jgi:glutaredoxin
MMKLIPLSIAITCFYIGLNISHADTLYKSVGPDGKIIYSDKPPASGNVQKTLSFKHLPSTQIPASTSARLAQLRNNKTASNPKINAGKVTLYTASWCGYCKQAKAYLASQKIDYREIDVESEDGMVEFSQAGSGGVPLLVAGKESVRGFSSEAYDAILNGQ